MSIYFFLFTIFLTQISMMLGSLLDQKDIEEFMAEADTVTIALIDRPLLTGGS